MPFRTSTEQATYRAKAAVLLIELKNKPCMDCGVRYPPYVMDFDHRDRLSKIKVLAHMPGRFGLDAIRKEADNVT